MRLLLTTLVAAVIMFFIIFTARIWGLAQTFPVFEHEFLTSFPLIIVKADQTPLIEQAVAVKKDVVIWVDARTSADKVVFLLPASQDQKFLEAKKAEQEAHPDVEIMKGGKLSDYSWQQINEFYKTTPSLKEVYEKFPQQRFIVNVIDNVANIDLTVIDNLKDVNPDKRTLIQSDTLVVMTSIKDSKPEWVYGTSQADLMRFLSFDSMWILSTTQYKGDVFIAPFTIMQRPAFNDDVIAEMRRRHKKVILGPITTAAQFDDAKRLKADGYITENLQQLRNWLDQSPPQ